MRRFGIFCLLGIVLGLCGTSALASTPAGVLSAAEYQTVLSEVRLIKAVNSNSAVARIDSAVADCRRLSAAGALLRAERVNCIADTRTLLAEHLLGQSEQGCKTRTSLDQRMDCLLPGYRRMHVGFSALHAAGLVLDRTVAARHFSNECAAALGDLPKAVTAEGVMAGELAILDSALQRHDAIAFERETGRFITSAANLVAAASKSPALSLCPRS